MHLDGGMKCNEMIEMNIFRDGSNFFKYDRPQSFEVELYLRKFEPKKVNRENCFYNDAQWNGNYGKILEKWKHDGTPYDIDSVMHYAAHISSIIFREKPHMKNFSNRVWNRNQVKLTGSTGRF